MNQRKSLSSQKIKKKLTKCVRNVLSLPYKPFWPLVPPDKVSTLSEKLQLSLKKAEIKEELISVVPWSQIRRLPKEERRKRIIEAQSNQPLHIQEQITKAKDIRKSLLLGVNSVTRGLEGGLVECCLIAEESSPKILVKHIATQAKHAKVPVLVVPELKSLTKNSLGVSTLALGFKKNVQDSDNTFHELCLEIKEIYKESIEEDEEYETDDLLELCDNINYMIWRKKDIIDRGTHNEDKDSHELEGIKSNEGNMKEKELEYIPLGDDDDDDLEEEECKFTFDRKGNTNRGNSKQFRFFNSPTILRLQSNTDKIKKNKKKR